MQSNSKITSALACVAILIVGFPAGLGPGVDAAGPLPTPASTTAYMHYESDGGRLWINALKSDPESKTEHTATRTHAASESWMYGFAMRQGPENSTELPAPLYLNTSQPVTGWFQVRFEMGPATQEPTDVTIHLWANGKEIGKDTTPEYVSNAGAYQFNIPISTEKILNMSFRISWIEHAGRTTSTMDTNGASFMTLPLVSETDGDGVPDHKDAFPADAAASKDSDGDKHPDEWNSGKSQLDSTTGLKLDAYPNDPTKWKKDDGGNTGGKKGFIPGFEHAILCVALLMASLIVWGKRGRGKSST